MNHALQTSCTQIYSCQETILLQCLKYKCWFRRREELREIPIANHLVTLAPVAINATWFGGLDSLKIILSNSKHFSSRAYSRTLHYTRTNNCMLLALHHPTLYMYTPSFLIPGSTPAEYGSFVYVAEMKTITVVYTAYKQPAIAQ